MSEDAYTDEVIRDLAKAAGCSRLLSDDQVNELRIKLSHAFIDAIIDGKPFSRQEDADDGKKKCG